MKKRIAWSTRAALDKSNTFRCLIVNCMLHLLHFYRGVSRPTVELNPILTGHQMYVLVLLAATCYELQHQLSIFVASVYMAATTLSR